MDLISNPTCSNILALDINDQIKFLRLNGGTLTNKVLTREDYDLTTVEMPSVPQPVDSYVVKCMTWCASNGGSDADTLAVGLSSGKIILMHPDSHRPQDSLGYFAAQNKPCICLSWSEAHSNLLAVGFERVRAENSLLVWDMTAGQSTAQTHAWGNSGIPHGSGRSKYASNVKPYAETCMAETINSLTWAKQEQTIVAGMGSKQIRLIDLRNIRSISSQVSTKAVHGISMDPCFDMRYASFYDNQIHIWDLRSFAKPAAVISAKYNVLKAEWCPTRNGLLATIFSGSGEGQIIHAYDMTHATGIDGDSEIAYRHIEQLVKPGLKTDETIGTFAWTTKSKSNLIAVTNTGALYNVNVTERISLNWTKSSRVLSASDRLYQCDSLQDANEHTGIEHIMHKRAQNGYGWQDLDHHDPKVNLEPDNSMLQSLWKWIKMAGAMAPLHDMPDNQEVKSPVSDFRQFRQQSSSESKTVCKFGGLAAELTTQNESSPISTDWIGIPSAHRTVYNSPNRTRALKMCGWCTITDLRPDNTELRVLLQSQRNVEKATAIALWHLDMRLATDILQQAATSQQGSSGVQYSVIAMALSGYAGAEGSSLWREMCTSLQKSLPGPYLQAAFSFLNAQNNGKMKYRDIFKIEGVAITDLVGFACIHLPDSQLVDVLDLLSDAAAKAGDLEGVIVTGLPTEKGVEMLQNYVNKTKDVQTAALAMIHMKHVGIFNDPTAKHMLDGYRNLLNAWMLWKERASLDVAVGAVRSGERTRETSQTVFVQCNYCGKSVRHDSRMMSARSRGTLFLQAPGMTSKVASCPSCRKPLPRCVVCCMYLGTSPVDATDGEFDHKKQDFELGNWFTWCPVCQHGGHAKHLSIWFKDHLNCPLSGCKCSCWSLNKDTQESSDVSLL